MLRCVLLLLLVSAFSSAQTVTYSRNQTSSRGIPAAQADINGDGILDIVSLPLSNAGVFGFYLTLSNSDGTHQAPAFYANPYNSIIFGVALGDFNNDGSVDVAVTCGARSYCIYLNRGDGTLRKSWNFTTQPSGVRSGLLRIAAADFNRDGKLDLVFYDVWNGVELVAGHGDGTFSAPVTLATATADPWGDAILIGDCDSDGNADFATTWAHCDSGIGCRTHIRVYFGDGKGAFSAPKAIDYNTDYTFVSDNVNSDKYSDLVGFAGSSSSVRILYGDANRSFPVRDVPLAAGFANVTPVSPIAVDLNGDGINDLALVEARSTGPQLAVLAGKSDGSYSPEQFIYSNSILWMVLAGRYDRNTKPDLVAWNSQPVGDPGTFDFLHNTSSGNFPPCAPPNAARGIRVCSLSSGTTVHSPVRFTAGAAYTSPLRKIELWIDGKKTKESFNAYASYAFLNMSVSLGTGEHRADIYTAAYDGDLQHVRIYFTVN
jgi:FG-GAP-like repeat